MATRRNFNEATPMTESNLDLTLSFSEVVDLIRQHFAYDDLGYAKAAEILDKAIAPHKYEYAKQLIGEHQLLVEDPYERGRYEAFDELHTKNQALYNTEEAKQ